MDDNFKIPEKELEKQAQLLEVNPDKFTKGKNGKKQEWKYLELNYEKKFIKKQIEKFSQNFDLIKHYKWFSLLK